VKRTWILVAGIRLVLDNKVHISVHLVINYWHIRGDAKTRLHRGNEHVVGIICSIVFHPGVDCVSLLQNIQTKKEKKECECEDSKRTKESGKGEREESKLQD
jgi:hypothetical protein